MSERQTHPSAAHLQNGSLAAAQERARKRGVLARSFLIGGSTILAVLGMAIVLFAYLCVFHQCHRQSPRVLMSTAPLGKVLTISQVSSHVVSLAVPPVMGLLSYQLAAQWLRSSAGLGDNAPSPLQLGLLMSICSGANLGALSQALKYVLRMGSPAQKQNLRAPRLLLRSISLLFCLLLLSYLAMASDAWFHATSASVTFRSTAPYPGSGQPMAFGRVINETRCTQAASDPVDLIAKTCGLTNGFASHDSRPHSQGLQALANSSDAHAVAFTDDQTAILVPGSIPPNITYSAQTVGLKASCQSITSECLNPQPPPANYGAACCLDLSCKGPTVFNLTLPGNDTSGPLDANGNPLEGYDVPTNPFNLGVVMSSQAYAGTEDTFINNTGWFVHGNAGAYNVVYCKVTAVDLNYTYSRERFTTLSWSPASVQHTRYIVSSGFMEGFSITELAVFGVGFRTGANFEDAFGLELTRRYLGLGAALYEEKNATQVSQELTIIGSQLDIIPFSLMISAMVAFGLIILVLVFRIFISALGVPYVPLASSHLTNPLLSLHALYGPVEPASTWEEGPVARFAPESEWDRLCVGPVVMSAANETIFMVTKKLA